MTGKGKMDLRDGCGGGVKVRNADRPEKDQELGWQLHFLLAPLDSSPLLESLSFWFFGPASLLCHPRGELGPPHNQEFLPGSQG